MTPATDSERDACVCLPWHPDTDGPDETCPQHGRPYAYWVEAEARMADLAAEQAATIETVEDLPDDLIGRAVAAGADAFGVLPDEIDDAHFDFARAVLRVVLDAALGSQRTEGQG